MYPYIGNFMAGTGMFS